MATQDDAFWRLHIHGPGPDGPLQDMCCAGRCLKDAASWVAAAARYAARCGRKERYVLIAPDGSAFHFTGSEAAELDRREHGYPASLPELDDMTTRV